MPDWLTHTLVGWMTGKTIKRDIGLIVAGSLIPDLTKINLAFQYFNTNLRQIFDPFHTPAVAFIVAGLFSLLFRDFKKAFIALSIGLLTHFILDFCLIHVSSQIMLFFPISWNTWQYPLIHPEDYNVTIAAVIIAAVVFLVYFYREKRSKLVIT